MEMLRLNNPKGIHKARQVLNETGALFVSFAAQGTHIPLLIIHCPAVKHHGYAEGASYAGTGTGLDYHYVAYMEFGGVYPLTLGNLHPGYVAEKLRLKHDADALNVVGFLNALGQRTAKELDEYLERLRMSPYDDTALDFNHYQQTGGPR
jgi:hypothetical protein